MKLVAIGASKPYDPSRLAGKLGLLTDLPVGRYMLYALISEGDVDGFPEGHVVELSVDFSELVEEIVPGKSCRRCEEKRLERIAAVDPEVRERALEID
jgi:hypothetical protein